MKSLVLGDLEQKIMSVIWKQKKSMSVREVLTELADEHAYTTVMTVMGRMAKKGILEKIPQGKSYLYAPSQSKELYANDHLNNIYQNLVGTYGNLAISQFIDAIKTDKNNLKLLEDYLREND